MVNNLEKQFIMCTNSEYSDLMVRTLDCPPRSSYFESCVVMSNSGQFFSLYMNPVHSVVCVSGYRK